MTKRRPLRETSKITYGDKVKLLGIVPPNFPGIVWRYLTLGRSLVTGDYISFVHFTDPAMKSFFRTITQSGPYGPTKN